MQGEMTHELVIHTTNNRLDSASKDLVQSYVLGGGARHRFRRRGPFENITEPPGCRDMLAQ